MASARFNMNVNPVYFFLVNALVLEMQVIDQKMAALLSSLIDHRVPITAVDLTGIEHNQYSETHCCKLRPKGVKIRALFEKHLYRR